MDGVTRNDFGTSAEYVAAYRHIYDVLKKQGVTNAVWVWNPTGYLGNEEKIAGMYPGDAYVDWIGYDPYNFHLCHGSPWRDTKTVLTTFYSWLEKKGLGDKPFMLAEFGSSFDPKNPAAMGDWYADMVPAMKALPNIKAAVHFNSGNGKQYCDYRITTNKQSMEGFAEAGQDPYLQPLG
nr:glycosyl hydrolase [Kineosporia babensis]